MFGLFGKKKNGAAEGKVKQLSPTIRSSIFNAVGTRSIPSMPGAAHKAFQLATDPGAEVRDFIEVIEADEALSARVLKIANSVYYDRGKKSSTIEESVLIIGIEELRNLLNANTLSDIFPSRHPARTQLWANDIATALISRSLAQKINPGKAAIAFLGGLMHDIGKLFLLQRSEDYHKVLKQVETEATDYSVAEEAIFPFDHTEVGQLIGEQWQFTPELLDIIRNHHVPFSDEARNSGKLSLPELVNAGDHIAHALGLGHPTSMGKFRRVKEESLDAVWAVLRISPVEQKNLLSQLRRTFEMEYDLYAGNFSR